MFFPRAPSIEVVRTFISSQRDLAFTYPDVGGTHSESAPPGFTVDHNRAKIGAGEAVFEQAVTALKNWRHFELGWVGIVPAGSALEVGAVVAVRAHTFGLWSLNAARVVYLIDEAAPLKRFGFAYGTLPDHVECGEERFSLEQQTDGSVYYDIFAFSRPRHPLARLGSILTRRLQHQFARDSIAAMRRAVDYESNNILDAST
jgi:uncharacterized protein (UPF0548 family)